MRIYTQLLILVCFLALSSCTTLQQKRHPYLQNSNKFYAKITKKQADDSHKYFKLTAAKRWHIYYDAHNMIVYTPLGVEKRKKIKFGSLDEKSLQKDNARKIYEHNLISETKKGNYWSNYLTAYSEPKDSVNIYTLDQAIDSYLKLKKSNYQDGFNYKLVKEKSNKLGEIIYFKYQNETSFTKTTHIDAIILGDKRVYYFRFQSDVDFYPFYFNDAIEIIKSLEINE
ncbi:hypothetical protein [uncultured Polaribacter sp.]|uniref:hypothetical protein n=1 Tax=uncultured Polaribacter sp. TaxID=174711 RepID=UPI0030D98ADC|tara:strand:+ start:824 stop:1504 length:681 start_codon:yes stop_codon:yes gene_type:complete